LSCHFVREWEVIRIVLRAEVVWSFGCKKKERVVNEKKRVFICVGKVSQITTNNGARREAISNPYSDTHYLKY
jgi:hypothetical protein